MRLAQAQQVAEVLASEAESWNPEPYAQPQASSGLGVYLSTGYAPDGLCALLRCPMELGDHTNSQGLVRKTSRGHVMQCQPPPGSDCQLCILLAYPQRESKEGFTPSRQSLQVAGKSVAVGVIL